MSRSSSLPAFLALALTIPAHGCSDDSDSKGSSGALSSSTAASFEGLYQIMTRLEDPSACGAGVPVVGGPGYFVAVSSSVLGAQILTVVSCVDQSECAEFAQAVRSAEGYAGFDFVYTLSEETSPNELSGFGADTGMSDGSGMCTERTYESLTLASNGAGDLALDVRVMALDDRPEEDGFCVVEPARSKSESASAPCVQHMTLSGTRLGDI